MGEIVLPFGNISRFGFPTDHGNPPLPEAEINPVVGAGCSVGEIVLPFGNILRYGFPANYGNPPLPEAEIKPVVGAGSTDHVINQDWYNYTLIQFERKKT